MSDYQSLEDFTARAGYTIEGVWYPRVTAILNIKAKPALYRYYGGMPSFKAADNAKERSAVTGSAVHAAVQAIMQGTEPVIDATISPSVDAFLEFRRHHQVEPLQIESQIISHRHGYAGTIDMLARVDGVVGVLDIKTGKAIYRDYGMQTAAYMSALLEDASIPPPQTTWILRLDQARVCQVCGATLRTKGGMVRIKNNGVSRCPHQWGVEQGIFAFQEVQGYEHNFKAFLAAKHLWEWEYADYLGVVKSLL